MSAQIPSQKINQAVLLLLEETFETVHGFYLDPDNSLLDTLAGISAAEASVPVGGKCATIAAQVTHVCFYLDALERFIRTGQNEKLDWGEVWRTVDAVTPTEWDALRERLRQTYQRIRGMMEAYDDWDAENSIGGAIGLVAHTAYHLGEIRQATCTVKQ